MSQYDTYSETALQQSTDTAAVGFDFSALGDLSGQAGEADAQFDLHYGAAQDEYLISCIFLAKIHALTAKTGRYGGGTWTAWYQSKGLSEGSARTMVKNGEAFKSATIAELKQLPELTRKDLNLIARSGCAEQLTEAAGDSKRVQELLAQIKAKEHEIAAEKERADAAEAREEEVWKTYNAESSKRQGVEANYQNILKENQQLRTDRVNAMNEADRAKSRLEEARDAVQAAKSARDAALADVQGLSEQNSKLKAENADLKKGKPLAAVVDEEEVDRLATEKAWGLADARNAEFAEKLAAVQKEDLERVSDFAAGMMGDWNRIKSALERMDYRNRSAALDDVLETMTEIRNEAWKFYLKEG